MENENMSKRRGRIVRKVYELNNVKGLVSSSKCHKTKTVVSVFNVAQSDLSTDEGFVWAVTCDAEGHNSLIGTRTLPEAKRLASDPDEFCDMCRDTLVANKPVEALFEITEPVAAVG